MRRVTSTDVHRHLSEVLDAVEGEGESFLITRGGREIARIEPVARMTGRALLELLRTQRRDAGWAEDLRAVRALLLPGESPWSA